MLCNVGGGRKALFKKVECLLKKYNSSLEILIATLDDDVIRTYYLKCDFRLLFCVIL